MASLALLLTLSAQGITHTSYAATPPKSKVFVSLSYAPTFAGITDFKVGEAYDNSTKALVPYNSSDHAQVLRSDRFDWMTMDGKLTFGNSSKMAVAGSVGLKLRGGAKFELEIGHEQFPAHYHNENGARESNAGLYLLAKDLANAVVDDKKEHLTKRLLNTPREDLARFAEALRAAEPKTHRSLFSDDPQGFGLLLILNDIGDPKETLQNNLVWLKGETMISRAPAGPGYKVWVFNCVTEGGLSQHAYGHGTRDGGVSHKVWKIVNSEVRDGSNLFSIASTGNLRNVKPHLVGKDLKRVHRDYWLQSKTGEVNVTEFETGKKIDVARFLANTIEGAEVVAIENVSSTSVMFNSCVDVAGAEKALLPYACFGLGSNFIRVSDGASVPRLAYKVKVGLGVQIAHNVNAFAGLYHHQVLGNIKNIDLPVLQLLDDDSPNGRTKDAATAAFKMAYSGCEVGLSFAF